MQQILALDFDGTSVDDDGVLGSESIAALEAAKEKGWLVCFVTGRRDIDMIYMDDSWRVADYLVLNNGGKIMRVKDDAVLYNVLVNGGDARRLLQHCLENHLQIYAVSGREWWVNKETEEGREYAASLGSFPILFDQVDRVPWNRLEGFMVTQDGDEVGQWIAREKLHLEVLPSEPGCIDVMEAGVSKEGGLFQLARYESISLERSVAVGNYSNDIGMLRCVGTSVAVASALDEVKEIADYVTRRDHNHDAVAEVVQRFVLK